MEALARKDIRTVAHIVIVTYDHSSEWEMVGTAIYWTITHERLNCS